MSTKQITNDDLKNIGVIGLDDSPGLTKADMQAKFEETARAVIIPRLNGLIAEFNQLVTDFDSLLLESGNVSPSQIEYWNNKADITEESYRGLTKSCAVGGIAGWYKAGEVNIAENMKVYEAVLLIRNAYLSSSKQKCGVLSMQMQLDGEGEIDKSSSRIYWITSAEFAAGTVCVVHNKTEGRLELYVRTGDAAERMHIAVLSESNAGEYTSLITTADNSIPELNEPDAVLSAEASDCIRITRNTFADGAVIDVPEGCSEWRASAEINTLTVNCPQTDAEAWIKFSTAAAGDVAISFAENIAFLGEMPEFGNGEKWELSVKDGAAAAAKEAE